MADEEKRNGEKVSESELEEDFFSRDAEAPEKKGLVDGADQEELERLLSKGPTGRSRHPILAAIIMAASLFVIWLMWRDTVYFFRGSAPKDLGDAAKALKAGKLKENTYVRLRGFPDLNSKARVTRRGCSVAPKASPDKFYTFTVLLNTDDSIVVRRALTKAQQLEEQKRPVVRLTVAGRLVRFKREKAFFEKYKRFLRRMSEEIPMLRREYKISREELAKKAGKRNVQVRDVQGRTIGVGPNARAAVYVAFLNELEFRLDRTIKVAADKVTFVGGHGPPCPSLHIGRDIVLERKKGIFDFGGIKNGSVVKADQGPKAGPPEKTGGQAARPEPATTRGPTKGPQPPLVLYVPPDTKVYDAKTGDPIDFDSSGRLVVAQGGQCGKPGTSRTVNLEARPFKTKDQAERFVQQYELPYALAEEEPDSFLFILRGPAQKLKAIVEAQRQSSPYSASTRTEWFEARWRDLKVTEDELVIRPARPSHPPRYELVEKGKGPGRLVKRSWGEEVRLPLAWVRHATISMPRELPEDAWLLMDGVKPRQFWYYPVLTLLLIGFFIFNAMALVRFLRRRD